MAKVSKRDLIDYKISKVETKLRTLKTEVNNQHPKVRDARDEAIKIFKKAIEENLKNNRTVGKYFKLSKEMAELFGLYITFYSYESKLFDELIDACKCVQNGESFTINVSFSVTNNHDGSIDWPGPLAVKIGFLGRKVGIEIDPSKDPDIATTGIALSSIMQDLIDLDTKRANIGRAFKEIPFLERKVKGELARINLSKTKEGHKHLKEIDSIPLDGVHTIQKLLE